MRTCSAQIVPRETCTQKKQRQMQFDRKFIFSSWVWCRTSFLLRLLSSLLSCGSALAESTTCIATLKHENPFATAIHIYFMAHAVCRQLSNLAHTHPFNILYHTLAYTTLFSSRLLSTVCHLFEKVSKTRMLARRHLPSLLLHLTSLCFISFLLFFFSGVKFGGRGDAFPLNDAALRNHRTNAALTHTCRRRCRRRKRDFVCVYICISCVEKQWMVRMCCVWPLFSKPFVRSLLLLFLKSESADMPNYHQHHRAKGLRGCWRLCARARFLRPCGQPRY